MLKKDGFVKELELEKLWAKLQDDFIEDVGHSNEYKTYLKLLSKYVVIKCDYLLQDDRKLLTRLKIIELKLKGYETQTENKQNIFDVKIGIEKAMGNGVRIDVHTFSVVEYYSYLNYVVNLAKNSPSNGRN